MDEPIDGYDTNQEFKAAHRTHQTISLSTSQQTHQPYQMKHTNNNNSNQVKRIFALPSGTLSLSDIRRSDAGIYICVASNTEGSETLEIQLSVIEALTVQILPAQQTVDLGKSTDLVSNEYWNFTKQSIKHVISNKSFDSVRFSHLSLVSININELIIIIGRKREILPFYFSWYATFPLVYLNHTVFFHW